MILEGFDMVFSGFRIFENLFAYFCPLLDNIQYMWSRNSFWCRFSRISKHLRFLPIASFSKKSKYPRTRGYARIFPMSGFLNFSLPTLEFSKDSRISWYVRISGYTRISQTSRFLNITFFPDLWVPRISQISRFPGFIWFSRSTIPPYMVLRFLLPWL